MKMRKGWQVVWPDGTVWTGDCPKWASDEVMPGAMVKPIRILGNGRWLCPGCEHGSH